MVPEQLARECYMAYLPIAVALGVGLALEYFTFFEVFKLCGLHGVSYQFPLVKVGLMRQHHRACAAL